MAKTKLSKAEEQAFLEWYGALAQVKAAQDYITLLDSLPQGVKAPSPPRGAISPNPDDPEHYYDYRGFYKALQAGEPAAKTSINKEDGLVHFPSIWKEPGHPTYQYKTPGDVALQYRYSPIADGDWELLRWLTTSPGKEAE
jgi:hypothetical protein